MYALTPYATPTGAAYLALKYRKALRMSRMAGMGLKAARMGVRLAKKYTPVKFGARRKRWNMLKKKRLFSRKNVGDPRGFATAKKHEVANGQTTLLTRTLVSVNLTEIDKTSVNDIDRRQRDTLYISGFKICMSIHNQGTAPLYVNIAILAPKGNQQGITITDFFRGFGTVRNKSFTNALTANEFHCLPINTDRYTVLRHMRFSLNGTGTTYAREFGGTWRDVDMYLPLKRTVRFESSASTSCETPVYLVKWCDNVMNPTAQTATTGMEYQERIITYFKEPK